MTITIRPGSTVMFTGDSITDAARRETEHGLGSGYALLVAAEWGLRHHDSAVNWLNTGIGGHKATDLEARWQADVLDARPDVLSILVGINDVGWHSYDPDGHVIPVEEFAATYDRLLTPLAEAGTGLILIEPFLLPIRGKVQVVDQQLGEEVREEWRADLNPKIQVVRDLAKRYDTHLLTADDMFTELAATTGPEYWSEDGVHPTPAGHAALAAAWLRLVA